MPFGIWTQVGPRKHVLGRGAHWHHLANTIGPSMCGSDAACCHGVCEVPKIALFQLYLLRHLQWQLANDH